MRRPVSSGLYFFVGAFSALVLGGCKQGVGDRCELDSDCSDGLICELRSEVCCKAGQCPGETIPVFDAAPAADVAVTGADTSIAAADAGVDAPVSAVDAPAAPDTASAGDAARTDAAADASLGDAPADTASAATPG